MSGVRELAALDWYILLALATLAGCSTSQVPPRSANPNRYIYVTSANLAGQCYRYLGPVAFEEPFAAAVTDEGASKLSAEMRKVAVAKYHNDVDAIINVHSEQNDAGTAVKVTGNAVELVNHATLTCALRDLPPIIDSSAAAAGVGIIGTIAGGLLSGSPNGAMSGGALGAGTVAAQQFVAHQQNEQLEREQLYHRLLEQQRQIRRLLAERGRLTTCQEQEIPLAECKAGSSSLSDSGPPVSTHADYEHLSSFELQKQAAENHDYILNLQQQITDIESEMNRAFSH
jgi:hypothetical protein